MKVLIFGGGAVGLGISSCLAASGIVPDILARPDTVAALNTAGLYRTGIFGDGHYTGICAFGDLAAVSPVCPYDFILVCTKSNDSESAARQLSRHTGLVGEKTAIVLCQNGWGNRDFFLTYFPPAIIYNARVITGFQRHGLNRVSITVHVQPMTLGSLDHKLCPELASLRTAIAGGSLPCEITETIEEDLWAKMLFNCALNPLGAIFGVPYGELKKAPQTRAIIRDVVHEIFTVIGAAGFRTYWEDAGEYHDFLMQTLIPGSAEHESSTLQDVHMRKKTEIDALTGAVVRLALDHGISVPTNLMLYRMICFMEGTYLGHGGKVVGIEDLQRL